MLSSPRQTITLALILLCAGLCLSPALMAAKTKDDDDTIPPPPMAQPVRVSIYQGHSVDIPLKVIGRTSPPLKFFIRTQPEHGTLSDLRIVSSDSAEVTYTQTDADGPGEDGFSFAAQALGTPVSAPGRVEITVSEEPTSLSFQHGLDFGPVYLGESPEQDLVLRNTGGGLIIGHLSVPAPWSVVGTSDYRLGRHGSATIHIRFQPNEARKFLSSVDFSGNVGETVELEGTGVAPFETTPRELDFSAAPGEITRSATIRIKNNGEAPRTVHLSLPAEITGPATVAIPADGSADVPLQTSPSFTTDGTGHLSLTSGGFSADVPFAIFAPPPCLAIISGDHIDFGDVLPGRQYQKQFTMVNKGAAALQLHAEYPPEIGLSPDLNGLSMPPGATTTCDVIFESGTASAWQGKIMISAVGTGTSQISLSAKSSAQPGQPGMPGLANAIQTAMLIHHDNGIVLDEGRPPGGYSGVPPITDIRIFSTGPHFLELAWPKVPNAAAYRIEQRMLDIAPDGRPRFGWREVRIVKYREENGDEIVRFDRLQSGLSWVIRISSVDGTSGSVSAPSKSIRLIAPPRKPWHIPWWSWALVAGAAGYWFWRRKSRSDDQEAAIRIARLGKS